ncbi:unnamed protein product [Rhizophagus irregularis]|uniref:Uncharacterized protein n=1 Tax=Rhizophagus irregularis TaxID=588596 RepID=A0A915YZP2_9GLOM|nr:unnamed protein product [Rhizophagus irregularis]CAB5207602.1 unnamed protein product [Rhizophagus irregularis]CAB5355766.1 unnamed protein product [Rhizophagus irregularis]
MSSDKSEEIPWLEDLEVEEASSSEASGSKSLLLNQASKASINSKRKTTRAKLDMGIFRSVKASWTIQKNSKVFSSSSTKEWCRIM